MIDFYFLVLHYLTFFDIFSFFFRIRLYLLFIFELLNLCDVYFSVSLLY